LGKLINAQNILKGTPQYKNIVRNLRHRWAYDIRMHFRGILENIES
jgi:hypothetical protein